MVALRAISCVVARVSFLILFQAATCECGPGSGDTGCVISGDQCSRGVKADVFAVAFFLYTSRLFLWLCFARATFILSG